MRATPKMIKNKTYGRAICNQKHCSGTAKGSGNSELGNNSEESHITTSSQESSPQENNSYLIEIESKAKNREWEDKRFREWCLIFLDIIKRRQLK